MRADRHVLTRLTMSQAVAEITMGSTELALNYRAAIHLATTLPRIKTKLLQHDWSATPRQAGGG